MGRLDNRVAIITGGTSGIGEATAEVFVEEGATVIISGRSEEKGHAIAGRLGERALFVRADVTSEDDIQATVALAEKEYGRLDILFNNAGGPTRGPIEEVTPDDIDYAMQLLFSSVVLGIRVNTISPGAIATPIFWGGSSRANTLSDEENARKMEKLQGNLARATPLQKSGLAQDIAYAALYLASDEGRFVNCHDLVVDGGRTAMFNEPG